MLNILWIVHKFPNQFDQSEGIFHFNPVQALKKLKINVEVLVPTPKVPFFFTSISKKYRLYKILPSSELYEGVNIYRPKFLSYPYHEFYGLPHKLMYLSAKSIENKYDLIHAHMGYPFSLLAYELSKRWSIPFLLTYHGGDALYYPFKNILAKHRFLKSVKNAAKIIAVSDEVANKINVISGLNARVLPIGIDLAKFTSNESKESSRIKLKIPQANFVVLFVGHLIAAKGILEFKQAIDVLITKSPEFHFIFIGDGKLKYMLNQNICSILGSVPNETIPQYMNAADVFILPSYSEGMPTVLVEAGAAKLPIVASKVGGIVELLKNGERGTLINPHNVDEIVDGVLDIKKNYNVAKMKANILYKYVKDNYNVNTNAQILIELYNKIAK